MGIFTRDHESAGPPATPGRWYGRYHTDWERDHPGLWVKGEAQSGSFYADGTIIDHCDPQPTILGLASAWITVVDYHGLDPAALLDSMRRNLT